MLNRSMFRALTKSTKLRSLVSELANFQFVVTPAQYDNVDHANFVLHLLSRRIWKGEIFGRNNLFAGQC